MKVIAPIHFKCDLNRIFSYILAILLLITTNSVLLCTSRAMHYITKIRMLIVLGMAAISVISLLYRNTTVGYKQVIRITAVGAMVLLYVLVAKTQLNVYIQNTMFLILISMFYFVVAGKNDGLWEAFVNVVTALSVLSLFFYVFGSVLHLVPASGNVSYEWGDSVKTCRNYYWLYFEAQTLDFLGFHNLVRNSAIYPEGTMFGVILSIAIGYELLMKTTYNKIKIAILYVTVLTTTATLAMISAILVLVFRVMARMWEEHSLSWKKIGLFLLATVGAVGFFVILDYKSSTDKGQGSIEVRIDHIKACLAAFLDHPLCGVGFNNLDGVIAYARYKQGMSVGLLYVFACGGLILGSIYLLPALSNILHNYINKQYRRMFFEILILFLMSVNAVSNTTVVLVLLGYFTAGSYLYRKEPDKHVTQLRKYIASKGVKL